MVGCCVNTLPLRARLAAAETVGDFIAQIRATALNAYQNADAALHTVMSALGRSQKEPLFQARSRDARGICTSCIDALTHVLQC